MEIIVSVLTTAYNHKPFIAQTIESIVTQKTDFPFELIIHDDASTDGTADIIREYAEKYPDIIRPICQTENQYSKGVDVYSFMAPLIRGKYVAECEGDDYWCDAYKLQKQVDFLEEHPEYAACVHNTLKIDFQTEKKGLINQSTEERDLTFGEICIHGSGGYHTSALMTKKELWLADFPEWVTMLEDIGDYPLAIFLALSGKIHYLPDVMSVYRLFTPFSWSAMNQKLPVDEQASEREKIINMLQAVKSNTKEEYHSDLQRAIEYNRFEIYKIYRGHRGSLLKKLNLLIKLPTCYKRKVVWDYIQYHSRKRMESFH